jgi:hypothetical protein
VRKEEPLHWRLLASGVWVLWYGASGAVTMWALAGMGGR